MYPCLACCMQVKWYSFQFLLLEMQQRFEELQTSLDALLPLLPLGAAHQQQQQQHTSTAPPPP